MGRVLCVLLPPRCSNPCYMQTHGSCNSGGHCLFVFWFLVWSQYHGITVPLISVLNIISIPQHNIFYRIRLISTTGREVYLHARPRQSGTCTSFDRIPQCSLARTPRRIHKLLQMLLFMLFVIPSLQLLSNTTPNLPAWIKCSLVLKIWSTSL